MTDAPSDTDEERLGRYAAQLASAIEIALPRWVRRSIEEVLADRRLPVDAGVRADTDAAAIRAQAEVAPKVRDLLALDIDEQRSSPLAILRTAVIYPTVVLQRAGVPPEARDETDERLFPVDLYGLGPASFADIDPSVHEPGVAWGAAKAYVHLARRRAEGRR
jgi:hypothetical protein